ncbi:hypothetical protein ACRARH_15930 [Phytobacter ursingii]
MALRLPGRPDRSPDKAFTPPSGTLPRWRYAYRGYQTVARTRRLRRHPGHFPGGAALTGATRP